MKNKFLSLDGFNLKGKVIGIRLDLNSPIINNKIVFNDRIKISIDSINDLIKRGAKIVLLSHQGSFGKKSCISLKSHKLMLEEGLKIKILFYEDILDKTLLSKLKNRTFLKPILLENLRFFQDERNIDKKNNKIKKIIDLFDYYILDCFSVSHRNHTSIAYDTNKPILCGKHFENEVLHLEKIENSNSPEFIILGGEKIQTQLDDVEKIIKNRKVSKIFFFGILAELSLICKGYNLGLKEKYFKNENLMGIVPKLKIILSKYKNKIILPTDLVLFDSKNRVSINIEDLEKNKNLINKYEFFDVGNRTILDTLSKIKNAKSIYIRGVCGKIEDENFQTSTKYLFKEIAKMTCYKVIGGGHTNYSAKIFNIMNNFDYISLGGGALIKYISGKSLVGVENLEKSFKKYGENYYEYFVIGSNVQDNKIFIDKSLFSLEMGSKNILKNPPKIVCGGSGFNMSRTLSIIGGKVSYLGKLSKDNVDFIKNEFSKKNIFLIPSIISNKDGAKATIIQTKEKDRIIFYYPSQNQDLKYSDFETKYLSCQNYLFGPLMGDSLQTQIKISKFIKKRENNSKICVVLNPSSVIETSIKTLIKYCDVVICNFEEAKMLTKEKTIENCFLSFEKLYSKKIFVITDGSQGAHALYLNKKYYISSITPNCVKDNIGAGDCFSATFFYFYTKKFKINDCLKLATKNTSSFLSKTNKDKSLLSFTKLIPKKIFELFKF